MVWRGEDLRSQTALQDWIRYVSVIWPAEPPAMFLAPADVHIDFVHICYLVIMSYFQYLIFYLILCLSVKLTRCEHYICIWILFWLMCSVNKPNQTINGGHPYLFKMIFNYCWYYLLLIPGGVSSMIFHVSTVAWATTTTTFLSFNLIYMLNPHQSLFPI